MKTLSSTAFYSHAEVSLSSTVMLLTAPSFFGRVANGCPPLPQQLITTMRQNSTTFFIATLFINILVGCSMLHFAVGAKVHPYTLYPPYIITAIIVFGYAFRHMRQSSQPIKTSFLAFCVTFIIPFVGGFMVVALRFMSKGYDTPNPEHNLVIAIILYVVKTIPYTMGAFGVGCFFAIPLLAFNIFMFGIVQQALSTVEK